MKMALVSNYLPERADGARLIKTYSDSGMMIRQVQTGVLYTRAIDVEGSGFTYVETDTPVSENTPESL